MKKRIKPFTDPSGLYQQIVRNVPDAEVKGKTILDIGCGSGWIETMLLEKGAKKVYGIDVDAKVIRKNKRKKLKNVVYLEASAVDLPFRKNFFDAVVCFEVLEHIPPKTEQTMFTEVSRVLKPGGKFYLSTPHESWIVKLLDPAWWLAGHRHYTMDQITTYMQNTQMKIRKLYVRGGYYTIFLFLSMYVSKWITHRSPIFYAPLLNGSREEFKKESGFTALFLQGVKSSKV